MTRTTPPRPVNIATVFPELLKYSRTTTRLHPRPGAPGRADSSVGGPLLWPADEPWPACTESHEGAIAVSVAAERRGRAVLAAAWARAYPGFSLDLTEEERRQTQEQLVETGPGPVPMLAAAQLYARDIPDFAGPPGTDLLQVLWCPFEHGELYLPAVVLKWRRAADVTDVLDPQPEPAAVQQYACYLPEPCVLHPERVLEYQYGGLLPEDLDERIQEWEEESGLSYQYELSIANGWKMGGWADWCLTDPYPVTCDDCGRDMDLLLTVATCEWDGDASWRPVEDDHDGPPVPAPNEPAQVKIGRGYSMWIFTCPASFEHPHKLTEE